MRWGGRDCCLSEGIMAKLTHACVFWNMCWSFGRSKAWTWSGVWWQNWCWPARSHVNKQMKQKSSKDTHLTEEEEKKKSLTSLHEYMLSDLDNGKKKPTENNQSTSIFQLVWFHLVALVFASVTVLTTRNWWTTCGSERTSPTPQLLRGLAGDGVAACWHPCHLLCLSGTSDAAGGKVWIRLVESLQKGSQLNLECTILACWQIWWTFMSQRRAIMDYSPALWSIEAFSYGLSSPALAPALFCVSFTAPFHFINVSFTAFLSDFLWNSDLFSSFAFLFLVWFWIAPALFFEVTSSVSPSWVWVLFQSSVFDLMVFCVFIKSLLLLNVQSVAFVQGKCLAPVQL